MTTDIETQQEKIELYYSKFDTWTNFTVRGVAIAVAVIIVNFFISLFGLSPVAYAVADAVAIADAVAGVVLFALSVAYAYTVAGTYAAVVATAVAAVAAAVFFLIFLFFLIFTDVAVAVAVVIAIFLISGFLSYAAVRRVYAIIVDRVPSKFIVYTDAKGEQFLIDALPACDATKAMKAAPCLKIIEQGGCSGLSIISGKLADFPYAKKIIDSSGLSTISGKLADFPYAKKIIDGAGIAKGDNLSAKWDSIKEAMVELAKERSGSDEGKNGISFINEVLEAADSPVFCQASKAGSELEIGHFKIRNFMLAKTSNTIVLLSIFLGVSLSALVLSVFMFFYFFLEIVH